MTYLVKLLVVGESYVGKTTLIQRYIADEFISGIRNTIGVDFFLKQITKEQLSELTIDDQLDLQIWDISGESRFREILPLYSQGTQGILFCFDTMENLKKLDNWANFLRTIIPQNIPRILLRTKIDLEYEIEQEAIDKFVENANCAAFFSTSSKNGTGVIESFISLAKIIYKRIITPS